MKPGGIDFDRGIIKIMGKGARERVVRIGQNTRKALPRYLLEQPDSSEYVWLNEHNRKLTAEGLRRLIRVLGKEARITGVRCSPHTFRHTFATEALRNGAGEFDVQSLLGHKDLRMTRRYSATIKSQDAARKHKRFSPADRIDTK